MQLDRFIKGFGSLRTFLRLKSHEHRARCHELIKLFLFYIVNLLLDLLLLLNLL